jgi:hypothetical protein
MKLSRTLVRACLVAALLVSNTALADGCLQGTWHYFDAAGRLVGERTVGCAGLDGSWGSVTASSAFTQGCASGS